MKVKLLKYTPDPEETVALAGRLCYSGSDIEGTKKGLTEGYKTKILGILRENGHLSTFEHVSFTFGIEGVSRVLTHQLVRHRIASYSQQSQRYVKEKEGNFEYVIPETIKGNKEQEEKFKKRMDLAHKWYLEALEAGIPKQDARFYLPNSAETKIIVTMNARSLINFFEERLCDRAQWEIRAMADKMLALVKEKAPLLFKNIGPACINGPCPEGSMTCGKLEQKRGKYKDE
ncbi:MAG: FAD-dependent thymidylate synthase [Fusobacteriota bacterium]